MGQQGVARLKTRADALIIVDVLSFSSCVSIAVARGATVFPYRFRDSSLQIFAKTKRAVVADRRGNAGFSLSPSSFVDVPAGTRVVLPSPNGSSLSLSTGETKTFAGCLRNARTVAAAAQRCGPKIAVIPAGERWHDDDSLRPSFEDLIGAGAIINYLEGRRSPEAHLAAAAFLRFEDALVDGLKTCSSGKELIERGFANDVFLSAQRDVDHVAPVLRDGAYRQ